QYVCDDRFFNPKSGEAAQRSVYLPANAVISRETVFQDCKLSDKVETASVRRGDYFVVWDKEKERWMRIPMGDIDSSNIAIDAECLFFVDHPMVQPEVEA